MKDKKEIGFDILENSGNDVIEKIGTDDIMINDKERKRILEMSKQKYNAAMNADAAVTQDSISGVEEYSRHSISRIVSAVVCTAAAALLVCTGILMLRNNNNTGPEKPDPIISTEMTTNVSTDTSTKNTRTTATSSERKFETHTTYSDIRTTEALYTEPEIVMNPPITLDTAAVSQDDLEAARIRALDKCVASSMAMSIDYMQRDINGDSIPELIVYIDYVSYPHTTIFVYNGEEYVPGTYYSPDMDSIREVCGEGSQEISPESHMIHIRSKEGHSYDAFLRMNEDNTFDLIFEYGYNGVWENGVKTSDDNMTKYWDLINANSSPYKWETTNNLINYHGYTDSLIKHNEEIQYREDHWDEIQAEYRREHPHDNDWAKVTIDCKYLYDHGILPDSHDQKHVTGSLHGVNTPQNDLPEQQYHEISGNDLTTPEGRYAILYFRYGDNGDKPVNSKIFFEINDTAITLFNVDFDFPNKRIIDDHGLDFSEYATVEYEYESDNY